MSLLRDDRKALVYLFERPYEKMYIPKPMNNNTSIVFNMPRHSVPPQYGPRSGGRTPTLVVQVNPPSTANNISKDIRDIPMGEIFSPFRITHREAAQELCGLFMNTGSAEELKNLAASIRDDVNECMFNYALSYTIMNMKALRGMRIPPIYEAFPLKFIPYQTISKARADVSSMDYMSTAENRMVFRVGMDFTGTDLNVEHRVAYWREDYGINAHHWHWHLVFPLGTNPGRDRQGELFYYMHQQMLARYDMERLSTGLRRVEKFENWREPIPEGYFSKLTVNNAGLNWGNRQDNTNLKDVTRDADRRLDVRDLELWLTRLRASISKGYFEGENGQQISMTDDLDIGTSSQKRGIDLLGDALEANNVLSPNFNFYGDLHNEGHVLASFAHDPDGSHREEMSVMGDSATAMRDPYFYRWHKFIDDVFQEYKMTQRAYDESDLSLPGIKVTRIGVVSGGRPNVLVTGYNMRTVEASRGLDFGNNAMSINIELTHLDNLAFEHHVSVANKIGSPKSVMVRIFLAPKLNESGQVMSFMDQRLLWAEMDKFEYMLQPGENHIVRKSTDSSITIQPEQTFQELEIGTAEPLSDESFCGCGWPQHMLVPRGTPAGMTYQLYVLVTDADEDRVATPETQCKSATSYCGIRDSKFPDKRAMGFPFDRRNKQRLLGKHIRTTEDFAILDNSAITDISIEFKNEKM